MIRALQTKREALDEAILVFERLAHAEGLSNKEHGSGETSEKPARKGTRQASPAQVQEQP
jgi:hypothetical protein